MSIKEANVSIRTIDDAFRPTAPNTNLNTIMAIVSDLGPTEPTKVNSVEELINNYMVEDKISANTHITLQHAAKALQFTPIWVVRVDSSSVLIGKTSSDKYVYTDKNFDLLKTENKIEFSVSDTSFDVVYIRVNYDNLDDIVVYSGDDTLIPSEVVGDLESGNIVDATLANNTTAELLFALNSILSSEGRTVMYSVTEDSSNDSYVISCPSNCSIEAIHEQVYSLTEKAPDIENSKSITFDESKEDNYVGESAYLGIDDNYYRVDFGGSSPSLPSGGSDNIINDITFDWEILDADGTPSNGEGVEVPWPTNLPNSVYGILLNQYLLKNGLATGINHSVNNSGLKFSSIMYDSNDDAEKQYGVSIADSGGGDSTLFTEVKSDYELSTGVFANYNEISVTEDKLVSELYLDLLMFTDSESSGDPTNSINIVIKVGSPSGRTPNSDEIVYSFDADSVSSGFLLAFMNMIYSSLRSSDTITDTDGDGFIGLHEISSEDWYEGDNVFHKYGTSDEINFDYTDYPTTLPVEENGGTWKSTTGLYGTPGLYINSVNSISTNINDDMTSKVYISPASNIMNYVVSNDSINLVNSVLDSIWISIDDRLFYAGTKPSESDIEYYIDITDGEVTYKNFINKFLSVASSYYDSIVSDNQLRIFHTDEGVSINVGSSSNINVSKSVFSLTSTISDQEFALVLRYPSTVDLAKFKVEEDATDIYKLTTYYNGNGSEYQISMTPDKVNSVGQLVYYQEFNDLDNEFQLVELEGSNTSLDSYTSLYGSIDAKTPTPFDYMSAMEQFKLDTGIYYSFILNSGYENVSYNKYLSNLAIELNSTFVCSVPKNLKTAEQIIAFKNSCMIDDRRTRFYVPYSVDTTLGNFVAYISPALGYLESVINNSRSGREFVPLFSKNNGITNQSPRYNFDSLSVREKLLDSRINTVVYDKFDEITYFNDYLTSQINISPMSNDHASRMINEASHIVDYTMKQFLSEYNNKSTRDLVQTKVTNAIKTRIVERQKYGPSGISVICNEDNNPIDIIEDEKMVVDVYFQFLPGTKYIFVYQNILPLSETLPGSE